MKGMAAGPGMSVSHLGGNRGWVPLMLSQAQPMPRWERCVIGSPVLPVHFVWSKQHCVLCTSDLVRQCAELCSVRRTPTHCHRWQGALSHLGSHSAAQFVKNVLLVQAIDDCKHVISAGKRSFCRLHLAMVAAFHP